MTTASPTPLSRTVLLTAGIVVIAAGLHAAAATVNLLLISVLLAMSASPIAYFLERRGMKHGGAVMLTVLVALVGGGLVVGALAAGLSGLQAKLPTYQEALTGLLSGVEGRLAARGIDLHESIKPDTARMVEIAQRVVGGALSALGYSFFALILVALILLELPARAESDAQAGGIRGRFDQVSVGVRHFVALTGLLGAGQAAVNLLAMLLVGTDFAVVWGVVFFLLNFIPFGFAAAMIPPLVLTLLAHGTGPTLFLLAVFVVGNTISDNVVKPKLMGKGLGLSPLVIIVSLMFWSLVLGPVGAVLAVPLTIALTTMAPLLTQGITPAE
jgi:predicted PurR-regulated permease PerM